MAIIDQGTIQKLNDSNASDPSAVFKNVKTWLFTALQNYILPTAFFLVIAYGIWGAVQYFTAYGSEEKIAKGKKTMTYAIVGAVIIASAFLIIRYVNYVVTGSLEQNQYLK